MKLNETISIDELLSTGGIFKKISGIVGQPFEWLSSTFAQTMDESFYLEHSGEKTISPFVQTMFRLQSESKINDALLRIANTIVQRFTDKWNKIYSSYIDSDYNPLENYSMVQKETPDITKERTETIKEKTTTETDVEESNVKTYGFNSSDGVPQTSADGTTKVTTEKNPDENENHVEEKETGTRELERSGNIGVTTSQQMLESELQLRKFNFMNMLMNDVASVMCLSIY